MKVLFLASNPLDQSTLRLDEEAREIEERIRKAEHRDVVDFESKWAVRSTDVIELLNREAPQVIHFSGHGSSADEVVFQDRDGLTTVAGKKALGAVLATVDDSVRVVVFNNCYSARSAEEAVLHVDAAIGMSDAISDDAARTFSAEFYASITYGNSVKKAFDQARAQLMMSGIKEEDTPTLHARVGVDLASLVLVGTDS